MKRDDSTLALVNKEKAHIMNSYFTTVGQKLASNFPPTTVNGQGATSGAKDERSVPLLTVIDVLSLAIRNKIEALKKNKSAGLYNIPPKLLRLTGDAVIPSLRSLYRYSIETKTFFTSWKTAKITPVFKKDNETDRRNYRPVSLLHVSVLSKILESLVNDALDVTPLKRKGEKISDKQWAYLVGRQNCYWYISLKHERVQLTLN